MDEFLFSGESIIERKGANFLIILDEHELPRFGPFGLDTQMRLAGLPEKHESIGGRLYLTNFRLFFQSHRINRFTGTFSIFLPNIVEAKDISRPLTLSKVMKISTRTHIFDFVIWKIPKFIAALTAVKELILPSQIEELRTGIRNTPENCGDGMNVLPPVMDSL